MATPQVLILQHVPWERPGRILSSLEDIGLETVTMNIVDKKKPDLPDFGELAGVVIMGGPMGALDYDKYPGLKAEAKLARAAVASGKSMNLAVSAAVKDVFSRDCCPASHPSVTSFWPHL